MDREWWWLQGLLLELEAVGEHMVVAVEGRMEVAAEEGRVAVVVGVGRAVVAVEVDKVVVVGIRQVGRADMEASVEEAVELERAAELVLEQPMWSFERMEKVRLW